MSVECVKIADPNSGASARVLVGFGFNCFQFRARDSRGDVELLWSEDDFESGDKRPSGSGIPLLFPFPGRIPGVSLHWRGGEYPLQEGDGRGNAIHGFVHERPWRVVDHSDQHVTGEFQASRDDASLLACWPSDFLIRTTYRVRDNKLLSSLHFSNPGSEPLPCGFGSHPYFRLPLGKGDADQCRVGLPVTREWELEDMLPTGVVLDLHDSRRYQNGLPFSEMHLDNVFCGLVKSSDGVISARIDDEQNERRLAIRFDSAFRECVVYNPPHREAVCIEPYTCLPGAMAMPDDVDTGLRVLSPGQSFDAEIEVALSELE